MKKFFFIERYIVELIVENGLPTGGASVQSLVWMKSLNSLGAEVYLGKLENDHRILKDEYKWVNLKPIYDINKYKKYIVWFSYRFPNILKVLKKNKVDYLYTSMPNWASFYIGIICKILKIKHIIRTANDKNIDFKLDENLKLIDRVLIGLSYKMADLILAQNEFQYQNLKLSYPNKNIIKIPNPIVLKNDYLKVKESKSGYIAWIANFRFQKNLKLLFEIAIANPDESFLIAGKSLSNNIDNETEIYLEKLKSVKNVEFVGSIPQHHILDFLSKAKFLLNTSRYEGFSNTFLEAMITGTPILTTPNVNPDHIISKYNLGLVFKTPSDLKKQLENLKDLSYLKMSENCLKYVKENHDHIHLGKKLLKCLK